MSFETNVLRLGRRLDHPAGDAHAAAARVVRRAGVAVFASDILEVLVDASDVRLAQSLWQRYSHECRELYALYRKLYFAMGTRGANAASMGDVLPELRRIATEARG